jgi:hypothetical protein
MGLFRPVMFNAIRHRAVCGFSIFSPAQIISLHRRSSMIALPEYEDALKGRYPVYWPGGDGGGLTSLLPKLPIPHNGDLTAGVAFPHVVTAFT